MMNAGAGRLRFVTHAVLESRRNSWHAVLTTSNRGDIFENSLWGVASVVIVVCLVAILICIPAARTLALGVWAFGGVLFAVYIFTVDVPMYRGRWKCDLANASASRRGLPTCGSAGWCRGAGKTGVERSSG
jgi:hypothetical protein